MADKAFKIPLKIIEYRLLNIKWDMFFFFVSTLKQVKLSSQKHR